MSALNVVTTDDKGRQRVRVSTRGRGNVPAGVTARHLLGLPITSQYAVITAQANAGGWLEYTNTTPGGAS